MKVKEGSGMGNVSICSSLTASLLVRERFVLKHTQVNQDPYLVEPILGGYPCS